MVSKSSSVRSIRLQNELWDTIKADADARGENVNSIIARHLRIAYRSGPLKVSDVVDVTIAAPMTRRITERLRKAELASVPVFERKAFNPQPKKGAKR